MQFHCCILKFNPAARGQVLKGRLDDSLGTVKARVDITEVDVVERLIVDPLLLRVLLHETEIGKHRGWLYLRQVAAHHLAFRVLLSKLVSPYTRALYRCISVAPRV